MSAVQNLGDVILIDTEHIGNAGTVGAYLLPYGQALALIETGPSSTLPALEAGIRQAGYEPEALQAVFLTHIHLDHGGAAGTLAQRYGATVYVHEVGAPHLRDPSRLMASATRIYGEQMDYLWGTMEAVPEGQLRVLEDNELVTLGQRSLRAIETPGHASHHFAYLLDDGSVFSGDAAAIRFAGSAVVRPALPPPEVNLELWDTTLERLRQLSASRLLLTHFGEVLEVDSHLEQVRSQNWLWAKAVLAGMQAGESDSDLMARIEALSLRQLEDDGADPKTIHRHRVTSNDAMTVMGLSRYWRKHHPEKLSS